MVHIQATMHAGCRQAQRNLSDDDIAFVFAYGRHVRAAGALHIFLGRRDIPKASDIARCFAHLEGTVLIMDDTADVPVLITAYRNRRGLKAIRTKTKYNRGAGRDDGARYSWA